MKENLHTSRERLESIAIKIEFKFFYKRFFRGDVMCCIGLLLSRRRSPTRERRKKEPENHF
jgi:hypothetical protein